jgi:hypothetical protein
LRTLDFKLANRAGPGMLATLPDRDLRAGERWVSKRADCDSGDFGPLLGLPKDGPAALRAKVEGDQPAAVSTASKLFGDAARQGDALCRKPRLNGENASSSALAFEAVAHRNADEIALAT